MVSQQWLDKKRAELNPYLLLGAPIVCISSLPLFNWLCQTYTWSGACLISAGIILNSAIVILLFDRNLDDPLQMYILPVGTNVKKTNQGIPFKDTKITHQNHLKVSLKCSTTKNLDQIRILNCYFLLKSLT